MADNLFPDPFLKNQNWVYLWINSLKVLYSFFLFHANLRAIEIQGNRAADHLHLHLYNTFLKNKKRSGIVSLSDFLHAFWRKMFLLLYSIKWPSFSVWLHLIRQKLSNMCIVIASYPGCDVMNFKTNRIFLTKLFFPHDQNFKTKI